MTQMDRFEVNPKSFFLTFGVHFKTFIMTIKKNINGNVVKKFYSIALPLGRDTV